ncbi:hypothetical protein SAY87_008727 [Trapa incisa]|uniref:Uncharacterized protein n=1 Tax=Trapa incisa TaxID=236973 RepID=A0AAN7Q186_9MYRT|nr:hypothetical protein SAY87_008727 [Trapa incisa]
MILRSTKKFIQKTFHSVKYILSGSTRYQKLPKGHNSAPSFNLYSGDDNAKCSQALYSEKTNEMIKAGKKKTVLSLELEVKKKRDEEVSAEEDDMIPGKYTGSSTSRDTRLQGRRDPIDESYGWRGHRSFLVAKKLKEMEIIDAGNADHVTDIQEVLHYYSLLTCPAYLDIVDRFFLHMYAEFLRVNATLRSSHS